MFTKRCRNCRRNTLRFKRLTCSAITWQGKRYEVDYAEIYECTHCKKITVQPEELQRWRESEERDNNMSITRELVQRGRDVEEPEVVTEELEEPEEAEEVEEEEEEEEEKPVKTRALATATGVLSRNEQSAADKLYLEMVKYFIDREKTLAESVLVMNWEKGKFVSEFMAQPRKYGNRKAEQLASDIGASTAIIYAYQRFHALYTKERIQYLASHRVAWHGIFLILAVHDPEQRAIYEQHLIDRTHSVKEIQLMVKNYRQKLKRAGTERGRKVDNRGGVNLTMLTKQTTSFCVDSVRKMAEFRDYFKDYESMPDSPRKTELSNKLKDCKKALTAMRQELERTLKLL